MNTAPAWLLRVSETLTVAIGEFELVHTLTDKPPLFNIPKTPPYCSQVILWEDKPIAVMDLEQRFLTADLTYNRAERLGALSIIAYQSLSTGDIDYGALWLDAPPKRELISDEQQCALPQTLSAWRPYALSCFQTNAAPAVPVICLERLFANPAYNVAH